MTIEDKQLLLIDLSARLPYRVIVKLDDKFKFNKGDRTLVKELLDLYCVEGIKPYLRSRSSITMEEIARYRDLCAWNDVECYEFGEWTTKIVYNDTWESIDYLNSIHVDYRGLIPMGLAIEVTKENNPYKELKL